MSSTVRLMIALTAGWTLFNVAVIVVVFVFVPLDGEGEAPPSAVAVPPAPPDELPLLGLDVPVASADGEAHEEGDAHDEPVHDDPEGRDLFAAKGCSACHGQDAEGTAIAPALAGHTEQTPRALLS